MSQHEKDVFEQSQRADTTFHGGGNAYEQSIHGSFDYQQEPSGNHSKYKHSETVKHVPMHQHTIPDHHQPQVVPSTKDPTNLYDIDELALVEQKPPVTEHHGSHHHKDPGHFGGHTQHHTVVHIDDPNARSEIAHHHAIDVHAPTVTHAADDGIVSSRCLVGTCFLSVAIGIIIVLSLFAGIL